MSSYPLLYIMFTCLVPTNHINVLETMQVDSFAIARDSEMHEATRRILSVLLRQVKHCVLSKDS